MNDYSFCITFLGYLCLWEYGKKAQMKTKHLIKYEETFHEDSHQILVYQGLQVLCYVSVSRLPMGTREKSLNQN